MISQNITVKSGATNVNVNLTAKGYFQKTDQNKVLYTETVVSSGTCSQTTVYNMPTSTTTQVVVKSIAQCVISGPITKGAILIVDGEVDYGWYGKLTDTRTCSGYL